MAVVVVQSELSPLLPEIHANRMMCVDDERNFEQ